MLIELPSTVIYVGEHDILHDDGVLMFKLMEDIGHVQELYQIIFFEVVIFSYYFHIKNLSYIDDTNKTAVNNFF